ncbi:MAG TPA: hypothetical protein VN861_02375 [Candidatus Acidoferrales bacterium]|nr:hypothetical protein [Candidatus Acidoferrales bacterium]
MKKLVGILALGILALGVAPQSALADSSSITVSSSFAAGSPTTPFSAPGDAFSFSFNLPSSSPCACGPTSNGFDVDAFVNYTLGSTNFTNLPAVIAFAPSSLGGLFDVEVTVDGVLYDWFLIGSQLYTVNSAGTVATLLPNGTFGITPGDTASGSGSFFFDTNGDFAPLPGGSVQLTSRAPEPSALLLLICGCISLAALKRKFLPA